MTYKTYSEQLVDHLCFLRSNGFDISELKINSGFVRCAQIDVTMVRHGLAYKTSTTRLENGLLGIGTWCRCPDGRQETFQTYGYGPTANEAHCLLLPSVPVQTPNFSAYEDAARRAYGFWMHSETQGISDYLKRKGVGHHGIRFRNSEQYGNVAVVPMCDVDGRLWSYQLLNADGSKHNANGGRVSGLFHFLRPILNGFPFGIAESYVTAATCMEITGIPTVCAFSSNNIKDVARPISGKFPDSVVLLFADNDRHLETNVGIRCAEEAAEAVGGRATILFPDFGDRLPAKDESDWNDFFRAFGKEASVDRLSIFESRV